MIDLDKQSRRRRPCPDEQAPSDTEVLPWQAWAAFCDFHEGVQAMYAQIGFTPGQEPELDSLWNFFINVVHRNLHHTRGGSPPSPMWRPLAEWCQDADSTR